MVKRVSFCLIHYAFSILMICIAFATIVVDKNIDSAFPNTVIYPNVVYYLIALVILWGIVFIRNKFISQPDLNEKVYMAIVVAIPSAVFVFWQIPVSGWIYWFTNPGDFGSIMLASIGLNNGQSFADWTYFLQSPNNVNISIALSWLYKIVPNWKGDHLNRRAIDKFVGGFSCTDCEKHYKE